MFRPVPDIAAVSRRSSSSSAVKVCKTPSPTATRARSRFHHIHTNEESDHHLQGEWALRRGGAQEDQLGPARLAQGRGDQDGSPSDRPALGRLPRDRSHRAGLDGLRIPLAGAPMRCCASGRAAWPSTASTCSARRWTSTFRASRSTKLREAGLRAQRGGVGFYPTSGSPFVHLDTGSVRHWPRMPEAQLAKVLAKGPLTQVASNDTPATASSGGGQRLHPPPEPLPRRAWRCCRGDGRKAGGREAGADAGYEAGRRRGHGADAAVTAGHCRRQARTDTCSVLVRACLGRIESGRAAAGAGGQPVQRARALGRHAVGSAAAG